MVKEAKRNNTTSSSKNMKKIEKKITTEK